jgi:RNA polymerase sigma-70 factor (ECF subfamily)
MTDAVEEIGRVAEPMDQRLVELAGNGDRDAFAELVESRLAATLRTASAILGNEADARDVLQEAFVSAWVNLPRLRDVSRFDAWLNRIVLNRCRDTLRRRRRAREIALDPRLVVHTTPEPDQGLETLNAAFERLPVEQRQLLILHHLHRQPVAEIAESLGVPVGTAKWRLHAARRALERALEKER